MNLVYFTIGGNPRYAQLLQLAIQSMRATSPMLHTHVMVMCDAAYQKHVHDIDGIDDIMIVPDNSDHIQSSMRKLEIYRYNKLQQYAKVMYLDCDLIVVNDIETYIFPLLEDPGKLYVYREQEDIAAHNKPYWGFRDYTSQQLHEFAHRKQHVFNCGHFGFVPTDAMLDHFRAVHELATTTTKAYFYEQSAMNWYFNTRYLTHEVLQDIIEIPMYKHKCANPCIIHFANASTPFDRKLASMHLEWDKRKRTKN